MRHHTMLVAIIAVLVVESCAANPVPVLGTPTDISALVGRWDGTYSSRESGREGSILFNLAARTDTAYGDILMLPLDPDGHDMPLVDPFSPEAPDETRGRLVTIKWVAVEGNTVQGTLSTYHDPDCGCRLETIFVGQVSGNTIEGTYTTRHIESDLIQHGRWSVTRQSQNPPLTHRENIPITVDQADR